MEETEETQGKQKGNKGKNSRNTEKNTVQKMDNYREIQVKYRK